MPKIASVSTYTPPYTLQQSNIEELTKELFQDKIPKLERLLPVFDNAEIDTRNLCVPAEWYRHEHSFEERNRLYIDLAVNYSVEVIERCVANSAFLDQPISTEDIDALIFVSSTGISTPSIDARVMNILPFSDRVVRIPIWGLGCAGGAAGISRAYDYCKAHPTAKVLVVCIELCSLTFQKNDYSKNNLIGTALFADGAACALVCGDDVALPQNRRMPHILGSASKWMPQSEDVMGWNVKNSGFYVIFSKSIPSIISTWLGPFIHEFLEEHGLRPEQIEQFVAHPGGKKVLQAYEDALQLTEHHTAISRNILKQHGNMSSPTVLYVLEQYLLKKHTSNTYGLLVALGPGFSGEAVLLEWRE
ncbi:3-oxoacyl-[acyl-carrier-protein] synthase III C-terminal domain-containing protein [Lysinibacillus sp. KU-BSD001]|uniref:type III polyketide synthase n=1 Tax=Lysinibacillus sp. KU-BSD001 TaxID=3141328 RepID=UPI0036ECC4DA